MRVAARLDDEGVNVSSPPWRGVRGLEDDEKGTQIVCTLGGRASPSSFSPRWQKYRDDSGFRRPSAGQEPRASRTNADKRRAVETLLRDEEWARWSDREIARQCGVSPSSVSAYRAQLSKLDSCPTERLGADGKVRALPKRRSVELDDDVPDDDVDRHLALDGVPEPIPAEERNATGRNQHTAEEVSRNECGKPPPKRSDVQAFTCQDAQTGAASRTTEQLRAINRAPDAIKDAYREGRISQTLAAKLGPKDPDPDTASPLAGRACHRCKRDREPERGSTES